MTHRSSWRVVPCFQTLKPCSPNAQQFIAMATDRPMSQQNVKAYARCMATLVGLAWQDADGAPERTLSAGPTSQTHGPGPFFTNVEENASFSSDWGGRPGTQAGDRYLSSGVSTNSFPSQWRL